MGTILTTPDTIPNLKTPLSPHNPILLPRLLVLTPHTPLSPLCPLVVGVWFPCRVGLLSSSLPPVTPSLPSLNPSLSVVVVVDKF